MFARRAAFEMEDEDSPVELAAWREFANAPTERAAFLAFVDRAVAAHPKSLVAKLLRTYADKMFAAVDHYNDWLRRGFQ